MSSSKSKKGEPEKDPYDVLGVPPNASDADIAKAYRLLARRLHPDKQKQGTSEHELGEIARRFHDIQTARAFLLDAEHAADRKKYDAKRAAAVMRQRAEEARVAGMSAKRKRMREELKRQEEEAVTAKFQKKKKGRKDDDILKNLAKQGREMRETYASRAAEETLERAVKEVKREKEALEDRQIRLKWSRKKLKKAGQVSPSEHSLAEMLSKYGTVEAVEMIGSKGNAALVTFQSSTSCQPCVKAYADSEEWRATFASKQRQKEWEDRKEEDEEDEVRATSPSAATAATDQNKRNQENVGDWKLRHAAERERLLRQMEEEEGGGEEKDRWEPRPTAGGDGARSSFPPEFPSTEEYAGLVSPLEKLEKAEALLLKNVLTPEKIQQMKIL